MAEKSNLKRESQLSGTNKLVKITGKKNSKLFDWFHLLTPLATVATVFVLFIQIKSSSINAQNAIIQGPYYQYQVDIIDEITKYMGEITVASENDDTTQAEEFNLSIQNFKKSLTKINLIKQDTLLINDLFKFSNFLDGYKNKVSVENLDPSNSTKSYFEIFEALQNKITYKARDIITEATGVKFNDSFSRENKRDIDTSSIISISIYDSFLINQKKD
jgi:hypothetical protein